MISLASISNDPNGRRRILFVAPDGSRKTIRLGKTDKKGAEAICRHVETLLAAKLGSQTVPRDTAAWLDTLSPQLADRLAAVELIEPTRRRTVAKFLADWLAGKRAAGLKPATLITWGQTINEMTTLFGERPLTSLEYKDGDTYRAAMQGRGLRPATVHKRLAHGRQMLEDAVRFGNLPANP